MTQTTDSDKQTGMVDDFEEVKRKLRLRSLYFPEHAYADGVARLTGNSVICILSLDFARFALRGNVPNYIM